MTAYYQLYVVNNGPEDALSFCVYHRPPDLPADAAALAWLVKRAHRGTRLRFGWRDDYAFAWRDAEGDPGEYDLHPADPYTPLNNRALFTAADGGFELKSGAPVGVTTSPGTLYVGVAPEVPPGRAYVGFAMAGACLFAAPAVPDGLVAFTPSTSYWLVGGDFAQGDPIDVFTSALNVDFAAAGTTVMTATLDGLNRWTLEPGPPPAYHDHLTQGAIDQ